MAFVVERSGSGAVTVDTGISGHLRFHCGGADLDGGPGGGIDQVIAGSQPAVIGKYDAHQVGSGIQVSGDRQQLVPEAGAVGSDLGVGAEHKQIMFVFEICKIAAPVRIGE